MGGVRWPVPEQSGVTGVRQCLGHKMAEVLKFDRAVPSRVILVSTYSCTYYPLLFRYTGRHANCVTDVKWKQAVGTGPVQQGFTAAYPELQSGSHGVSGGFDILSKVDQKYSARPRVDSHSV